MDGGVVTILHGVAHKLQMTGSSEIVLGGDASLSAPPLPTAAAVALPFAIPTTTNAGGEIERFFFADGSLSVKITTTTIQPNGYRDVQIEYFHIPTDMASAIGMSLDHGDPPSQLYLTKLEQQTLPPGTGAVISSPASAVHQVATNHNHNAPNEDQPLTNATVQQEDISSSSGGGCMRVCGICCGIACFIIILLSIIGAVSTTSSHSSSSGSSSYYPPSPSPHWYSPSYPTHDWNHHHPSRPTTSSSPTYWYQNTHHWTFSTSPPTISNQPTITPRPTYTPLTFSPALAPLFPPSPSSGNSSSERKPAHAPYYPPSSSIGNNQNQIRSPINIPAKVVEKKKERKAVEED